MQPALDLHLQAVTRARRLADGATLEVLRELTLRLPPGQTVGVIGRSGGGKTTLLRLLNRLEDPDAGAIYYGGQNTRELEPTTLRRRIALVNQRSVMFPGSVLDNIVLPDRLTGRGAGDRDRTERMIELVRLPRDLLSRDAAALSVGQQARVQLARVLYLDPQVLLLDESTANLDPQVAGAILDALHGECAASGATLLHVSHEPDKLRRCARLLLVDGGRVAADGPAATILDDPQGPAAAVLRRNED